MKNKFTLFQVLSLLEAVVLLALGLMFIFWQDITKTAILYVFAGGLMLVGIIHTVNYLINKLLPTTLLTGIIEIVIGAITIILANTLLQINILGILFGIFFLIISVLLFQWALESKKIGNKYWPISIIIAVLLTLFSIAIIFIANTESILIILLGTLFILDAVYSIIDVFTAKEQSHENYHTLKDLFSKESDSTYEAVKNNDDKNK